MKLIRSILRLLPIGTGLLILTVLFFVLLGRVERTVEAGGEVRVQRYQVIRPQVSGLVTTVWVETGQPVRRGQALVQLKDHELQQELISARQRLDEVRSRLAKITSERELLQGSIQPLEIRQKATEVDRSSIETALSASRSKEAEIQLQGAEGRLARARRLQAAGLISEEQLQEILQVKLAAEQRHRQTLLEEQVSREQRTSTANGLLLLESEHRRQIGGLEAEMRELHSQTDLWSKHLAQLRRLAELHTLRASMDGVVVSQPNNELVGRYVQAGENLLSVIDAQSVLFVTQVPEQAIVRVRPGQAAYVEISGLPKRQFDVFHGQVEKIAQEPDRKTEGSILYPVQIQLRTPWAFWEGKRFYLRSGMRGTAKIAYRQDTPILRAIYEVLVGEVQQQPPAEPPPSRVRVSQAGPGPLPSSGR